MASVFLYHVAGDLTVAKPELVEFLETETVESAIQAISESTESGIPIWRRRLQKNTTVENSEMRQQRFVGILNPLDIVAFLASDRCLEDQEKAMKTPVSEIVVLDNSLLKEVDPATRAALKHLKEDRLKKFEYCLPYLYNPFTEEEIEQSTVIDVLFPINPKPVFCEFDCELDELEAREARKKTRKNIKLLLKI